MKNDFAIRPHGFRPWVPFVFDGSQESDRPLSFGPMFCERFKGITGLNDTHYDSWLRSPEVTYIYQTNL